jgi:predicted nucleotidyltransferase
MKVKTFDDITPVLLEGPATASELAERAGASLPNVLQRLARMGSRGEVAYAWARPGGAGRPVKVYRLVEQVTVHGVVDGAPLDVRVEPASPLAKAMLNVLRIPQPEFHEHVVRWLCLLSDSAPRERPGLEGVELLCVFGSAARGRAEPDSDVDILIVVDKEWLETRGKRKADVLNEPSLISGSRGVVTVSPLPYSVEEYNRNKSKPGNLKELLKEAVLIWKRTDDASRQGPTSQRPRGRSRSPG